MSIEQQVAPKLDPKFFAVAREGIESLMKNIQSVITIRKNLLEYIIASKLAGGHVILADAHGVGKTSLARAIAGSINWEASEKTSQGVALDAFSRIQCTVDLLPQDILGFNRFDMQTSKQFFVRGPIFAHFVLCDEINLLTPKTQGSFLQAMEERVVTIEGRNYDLPDPFFIIATMNLRGAHLFPLPAPQLDRFMIRISLGYPEEQDELDIIMKHGLENSWAKFGPVVDSSELVAWTKLVDGVTINRDVLEYVVRFIRKTRAHPGIIAGASPRSGIKVSRMARALALVRGQDYVTIDLIKELAIPVFSHRIEVEDPSIEPAQVVANLLKEVKA